ncbi:hypothetical protein RIR_jg32227.t1 [Rhizophagus irregularis DAOM 181602=DAOM 197198]|nr:hypothetical protein RIR_jg32227.t1 [Rhizophagus irregularis DAOM 181602=DAOM 197198]
MIMKTIPLKSTTFEDPICLWTTDMYPPMNKMASLIIVYLHGFVASGTRNFYQSVLPSSATVIWLIGVIGVKFHMFH